MKRKGGTASLQRSALFIMLGLAVVFAPIFLIRKVNGDTGQGRAIEAPAGTMAAESANLAKQQILVQASASMVAQANSANNVALTLLQ